MMDKSIRIRTTPGVDTNIQIKVEQDFDFLEILSLKISQQDLYTSFCANYGVVVGRVIANGGLGVPNSKVSVFVPISSEDEKNILIKDLYPFKDVTTKNKNNIRYNLLLSKATCKLNKAVGSFPTKEEVLNNDIMIEVFDKYYKYTTKTNGAGDYMIFGVPTGQQTVHMDVDLSDAGVFSTRPYDFIDNGYSEKLFDSRTEFKKSENLDTLPQIKSGDRGVDVLPFWGDEEQCLIGITRVDFDTNFKFEPVSVFMGSIFTDNGKNAITKGCNPKNDMGEQCELRTGAGLLEVIRVDEYTYEDLDTGVKPTKGTKIIPLSLEEFTLGEGPIAIDENGAFATTVPMNLDHVITNEFGDLVPSLDPNKGVATKGMYRFKMNFLEPPTAPKRRTAQIIVPALNRKTGGSQIDLEENPELLEPTTENARWSDNIGTWFSPPAPAGTGELHHATFYKDFHTFEFAQLYTVSQYIPKFKKGGNRWSFIGLKDIDNCPLNIFPMNGITKGSSILYGLIKPIIKLIGALIKLICILANLKVCFGMRFKFTVVRKDITLIDSCGPNDSDMIFHAVPFSFLQGLPGRFPGNSFELSCESNPSFPQKISTFACDAEVNCTYCDDNETKQVKFSFNSPCCQLHDPTCPQNCNIMCIIEDWLCCALYDLAKDRGIIRFTFYDAWLSGSMYLPQFKYKSKTKGNGSTKDKHCGPGGDNRSSRNYYKDDCWDQRGIYDQNRCLVRGYAPVDDGDAGEEYHNNKYLTGASDTRDMIYCPESYPTKIINLGRLDSCQDTIDRIDRCITANVCLLELFQHSSCPTCYTGTGYEKGYDTTQWTGELNTTSYDDPALIILKHMEVCSSGIEQLFGDHRRPASTRTKCNEFEIDNEVWKEIHQVSKIHADMILGYATYTFDANGDIVVATYVPETTPGNSGGPLQVGDNQPLVQFDSMGYDQASSGKFSPSTNLSASPFDIDPDTELGDNTDGRQHHFRDTPYFYFGLNNGFTAMDRLRKDYLVKPDKKG